MFKKLLAGLLISAITIISVAIGDTIKTGDPTKGGTDTVTVTYKITGINTTYTMTVSVAVLATMTKNDKATAYRDAINAQSNNTNPTSGTSDPVDATVAGNTVTVTANAGFTLVSVSTGSQSGQSVRVHQVAASGATLMGVVELSGSVAGFNSPGNGAFLKVGTSRYESTISLPSYSRIADLAAAVCDDLTAHGVRARVIGTPSDTIVVMLDPTVDIDIVADTDDRNLNFDISTFQIP